MTKLDGSYLHYEPHGKKYVTKELNIKAKNVVLKVKIKNTCKRDAEFDGKGKTLMETYYEENTPCKTAVFTYEWNDHKCDFLFEAEEGTKPVIVLIIYASNLKSLNIKCKHGGFKLKSKKTGMKNVNISLKDCDILTKNGYGITGTLPAKKIKLTTDRDMERMDNRNIKYGTCKDLVLEFADQIFLL